MLERKGNNVLYPLERCGYGIAGEALAQHHLDAAQVICRNPPILLKELFFEAWEFERFELGSCRKRFHGQHVKRPLLMTGFGLPHACAMICGHALFVPRVVDLGRCKQFDAVYVYICYASLLTPQAFHLLAAEPQTSCSLGIGCMPVQPGSRLALSKSESRPEMVSREVGLEQSSKVSAKQRGSRVDETLHSSKKVN